MLTEIKIGSLTLKNPILNSSGMFLYCDEVSNIIDLNKFGAIVTKGISLNPIKHKASNRFKEIIPNYSYINAVGFENIGLTEFIKTKIDKLYKPTIINLLVNETNEIFEIIDKLNELDNFHGALELNTSCPNIQSPPICYNLPLLESKLLHIKRNSKYPIIVKLGPSIENIKTIAKTVEQTGVDAISLINTIPAIAIDIEKRKSALWKPFGGLSGPCIHPIALKMVFDVSRCTQLPIIGIGGVNDGNTAIAMIIAGATAVAIGTSLAYDTKLIDKILIALKNYGKRHNIKSINELIGSLKEETPQSDLSFLNSR